MPAPARFRNPLFQLINSMRIAVLDDDVSLLQLADETLTAAGHVCHTFSNDKEMLHQFRRESYELLIISWQISGINAGDIVYAVREKCPPGLPVMFLASLSGEDDILDGLAAGADDYMVKPVRRSELVTRVQALLRRKYPSQNATETRQFGPYKFETRAGSASVNDIPVDMTHKEFSLALLLFNNLGRPLSRAYILESVWSRDIEIPTRTIDTHISRVRSKLALVPANGYRLAPVYSYGYRLEQVSI
jgi:DNA-binding response OmpR family regulator